MDSLILCKKAEYFETQKDIIELAYHQVPACHSQRRELCRENQPWLYLFESYSFFGDFVNRLICDELVYGQDRFSPMV